MGVIYILPFCLLVFSKFSLMNIYSEKNDIFVYPYLAREFQNYNIQNYSYLKASNLLLNVIPNLGTILWPM